MTAYLDASAILPILFPEDGRPLVDGCIIAWTDRLIVSDFAAAEVASAFSRLVRMNLLDAEDAAERLSDFDAWRATATDTLELLPSDVRRAGVFVRRFALHLRAPDALHLAA